MILIGRRDVVDFPDWEMNGIKAKVDTGAYGCTIHCHDIQLIIENGQEKLSFKLLDPTYPEYTGQEIVMALYRVKKVKSSNGKVQKRYVVKTKLRLFKKLFPVEISLSDREKMKYPVLLGRKFLRKRFVVDVSKKNLSFERKVVTI